MSEKVKKEDDKIELLWVFFDPMLARWEYFSEEISKEIEGMFKTKRVGLFTTHN